VKYSCKKTANGCSIFLYSILGKERIFFRQSKGANSRHLFSTCFFIYLKMTKTLPIQPILRTFKLKVVRDRSSFLFRLFWQFFLYFQLFWGSFFWGEGNCQLGVIWGTTTQRIINFKAFLQDLGTELFPFKNGCWMLF